MPISVTGFTIIPTGKISWVFKEDDQVHVPINNTIDLEAIDLYPCVDAGKCLLYPDPYYLAIDVTCEGVGPASLTLEVHYEYYTIGPDRKQIWHTGSTDPCTGTTNQIAIDKVEWIGIDPGDGQTNLAKDNPNPPGGWRIFPGKNLPDKPTHKKVKVKAIITPPTEKVEVYFKSFDVDDPSSHEAPIDDETEPQDNRGTPKEGKLSATSATTNDKGVAEVEFEVTMQPGDNFRVVAALFDPEFAYLNSLGVKRPDDAAMVYEATGTGKAVATNPEPPDPKAKQSDLLTVWRKLHIERDSMGPVKGNFITGTIISSVEFPDRYNVEIDKELVTDEYENGTFEWSGKSYTVLDNYNNTVRLKKDAFPLPEEGGKFKLTDDDKATMPNLPDIDLLQEKFKKVYIEVLDDGGSNPDYNLQEIEFTLNVPGTPQGLWTEAKKEGAFQSLHDNKDDYWISYILAAYQDGLKRDNDPDWEEKEVKLGVFMYCMRGVSSHEISLVFRETIRDWAVNCLKYKNLPGDIDTAEKRTVFHEICHHFHLEDEKGAGIMDSEIVNDLEQDPDLTDEHINHIRGIRGKPGYPE